MNFEKNITDKCNTTVHPCSYNLSNHTVSIHMTFIGDAGAPLWSKGRCHVISQRWGRWEWGNNLFTIGRCLQLARWRLEYNPLWGKGILAEPLHSALMWAPFDLLLIFFFIFWAEVPPLLKGGILKRLPNTLENTNVFAGNNVKAWEQTYLPINAHSAVTSTSLNKSNGKRLCRKISLLRNKWDARISKSYDAI